MIFKRKRIMYGVEFIRAFRDITAECGKCGLCKYNNNKAYECQSIKLITCFGDRSLSFVCTYFTASVNKYQSNTYKYILPLLL